MGTIFVTGADGFAGRHLFQLFKSRGGTDVVGGVRNRARKLSFERNLGKSIVCDVSDAIGVARAIASVRPDIVVHLAGTSRPNDATEEPLLAYQSIVSGWANVLDAVRRTAPRAKIVLASACDVYGPSPENAPMREDRALAPVNTFGSLKAAAESIAHTFYLNYHLDITIARPFHAVGAGLPPTFFFGSVVRRLVDWDPSVDGDRLALPDLDYRRDVLHVQDLVEAYARLATDGKPNEVYNICSGQSHTVREVVELIARTCGRGVTLSNLPADGAVTIPTLWGSHEKLTRDTGWKPARTLADAVSDLVQSCRAERQRQPLAR